MKTDIKFCEKISTNKQIRAEVKMLYKCIFLFSLVVLPLRFGYDFLYLCLSLSKFESTKVEDYCSFGLKIALKVGGNSVFD